MRCCAARRRAVATAAAACLLGGCVPASLEAPSRPPDPGTVTLSGKVTRAGEGLAGARVYAYGSFEDFLAHRPSGVSGASGPDGAYRLDLPGGTYHLAARQPPAGVDEPPAEGSLMSYHGSNPLRLAAGGAAEVSFSLTRVASPVVTAGGEPGSGAIEGRLVLDGRPVEGAVVKLFLDAGSEFRGAGFAASPPTDGRGEFRFDYLPESAYFVVARRRAAGSGGGPLAEGDAYGYFAANPVVVRAGTVTALELEMLTKGREDGGAFGRARPGGTSVAGRITDLAGSAVPGVHAFAYEEAVMSHGKPAALSAEADAEGRYVLSLPGGGTYYLGARSGYGDSPAKGEWYGRYEGTVDHSLRLEAGAALEGIDIVVERILP